MEGAEMDKTGAEYSEAKGLLTMDQHGGCTENIFISISGLIGVCMVK
jgi:hypothetical protein